MTHMTVQNQYSRIKPPSKRPKLGIFVYLLCLIAVIGGFLFGYDTGIVSSAMLYVPEYDGMKPMSAVWKEIIVSSTPGLAAVGSLLAGPSSDRFGRKKVIIASSIIFAVGAVICAIAMEKIVLLIGRMLLGIAIGFTSMIIPIYVGEASPSYIRGLLVTGFQVMINFGMMSSNLIAEAFSYVNPVYIGWRLMLGCAMIPAVMQLIGFFFLPESPRYLYERDDHTGTEQVLHRIYGGNQEWVEYEMKEIAHACEQEEIAKAEVGGSSIILRMLKTPHVRKALFIGCALQMFQQLSGVNTIMYYTGTIIKAAGILDNHLTIWIASGISAFNFAATFIPFSLVERLGRRVLLLISIAGVALSLILLGFGFLLININSGAAIASNSTSYCSKYSNCDYCVTDDHCGFCYSAKNTDQTGYCLTRDPKISGLSTEGFCGPNGDMSLYTFHSDYCVTNYTLIPIVLMVLYLIFFATGYAPLPWVINSEIYPLWARGTGCAIASSFNWIFNLLVSLTFLSLSQAVSKFGAFFIYAGITLVAFVFVYIFVPETKGTSIDEVELLFVSKNKQTKKDKKTVHPNIIELQIGNTELV